MIRPWYRSRLFWLGLPGLVFLLWAWGDSMKMGRWIRFHETHRLTWVGVIGGTIDFKQFNQNDGRPSPMVQWGRERVDFLRRRTFVTLPTPPGVLCADYGPREPLGGMLDHEMENPFPRAFARFERREVDQRVSYRIGIALWLVLGGYVSGWCAVILLWQRRKARLSRPAAGS